MGGGTASRGGGDVGVFGAAPSELRTAFGVEFDGKVVGVEYLGHHRVGKGFAVHLLAPSAPGGVEVDKIEFGVGFAVGLGSLLYGFPFHLLGMDVTGQEQAQG